MTTEPPAPADPKRGELWLVDFNPTKGDEIRKVRPAIVMNLDGLGVLRLRVVVPCTSAWDGNPAQQYWLVPIRASTANGLNGNTTADPFQVKSVSLDRFRFRIGVLEADLFEEVRLALNIVLGND